MHTPTNDVIEKVRSPYQLIEIARHPVFGNQLLINGDLQISESDHSYNVAMTSPLIILGKWKRVAILGGGDGGVMKELLDIDRKQNRELEKALMIDIDSEVIRLSKKYLPDLCGNAFEDPKSEVVIADVFEYLGDSEPFDAVIYDLTIDPVREEQTRREFLQELMEKVANALHSNGMLNMQCCGTQSYDQLTGVRREEIMNDIYSALKPFFSDFSEQQVFVPSFGEAWTFLSARKV